MTISTLSPKNQTTLSVEFVRQLNLRAGTRLKQSVKNGKIILQPVPDVSTAFGALKPRRKFVSIKEETKGMEKAIGKQVSSKGLKA
jgi:antitoxin component of MazEF toxin-antitoxin module